MRVYLSWQLDMYTGKTHLLSAYDEETARHWNGAPSWHVDHLDEAKGNGPIRTVVLDIENRALVDVFRGQPGTYTFAVSDRARRRWRP